MAVGSTTRMSSPLREQVATLVYRPFIVGLAAEMACVIYIACAVLFYCSGDKIEPAWLKSLNGPLELVGRVLDPAESDASRALDTMVVTLVALVMGVFLRRCSTSVARFELAAVVTFLLLGMTQLALLLAVPSPDEAVGILSQGDKLISNIKLLLIRNSNIALAIFGSAIGVQQRTKG